MVASGGREWAGSSGACDCFLDFSPYLIIFWFLSFSRLSLPVYLLAPLAFRFIIFALKKHTFFISRFFFCSALSWEVASDEKQAQKKVSRRWRCLLMAKNEKLKGKMRWRIFRTRNGNGKWKNVYFLLLSYNNNIMPLGLVSGSLTFLHTFYLCLQKHSFNRQKLYAVLTFLKPIFQNRDSIHWIADSYCVTCNENLHN